MTTADPSAVRTAHCARPGELRLACLLTSALFLGEDLAVITVRTNLRSALPSDAIVRISLDVVLASTMLAYNFLAARFVVTASSSARVAFALEQLTQQRMVRDADSRQSINRSLRKAAVAINPLNVVIWTASGVGRVAAEASSHGTGRAARLLGELGAVNLLGVPGVSLSLTQRGVAVPPKQTLRHCCCFVFSWFVGAWVIEAMVSSATSTPLIGRPLDVAIRSLGRAVSSLTDVTRPIGCAMLTLVLLAIVRYTRQVERAAAPFHP